MDYFITLVKKEFVSDRWEHLEDEFLKESLQQTLEIARAAIENKEQDVVSPRGRPACYYHEHAEGGPVCAFLSKQQRSLEML